MNNEALHNSRLVYLSLSLALTTSEPLPTLVFPPPQMYTAASDAKTSPGN